MVQDCKYKKFSHIQDISVTQKGIYEIWSEKTEHSKNYMQ